MSSRIAEQFLLDLYMLTFLAAIPSTKLQRLNLITRNDGAIHVLCVFQAWTWVLGIAGHLECIYAGGMMKTLPRLPSQPVEDLKFSGGYSRTQPTPLCHANLQQQ